MPSLLKKLLEYFLIFFVFKSKNDIDVLKRENEILKKFNEIDNKDISVNDVYDKPW